MRKPSYKSYKGMSEPKEFGDYLERLQTKVYDKKKKAKGIKPLVDPKKSRIPGVSTYLKKV
jgi:hypothetical protein